jgi:predicted lipoprotein with Yx(FWY)xxD motif
MRRKRPLSAALIAVILGVGVLTLAVSSGSAKKTSNAGTSSVSVKQTPLGGILVGAGGRTLYLFQADKPNHSTLSRAGFVVWPAFTTSGTPRAAGGARAADIGTIGRSGGRHQVTYNGHPLYYFVGDRQAGSTAGQGLFEFGAKWYVLSPSGKAITSAPRAPAPAAAEPSGGGYGY